MTLPKFPAVLLASWTALPALAQDQITVTDDLGRKVVLDLPVERAIVLNSYAHELLRAVGVDDRIVGQDQIAVDRLPYIHPDNSGVITQSQTTDPNYEAIIGLDPDVIIAPRNSFWEQAATKLEPFGIDVVVLTAWDTTKFKWNAELAGRIFQEGEGAAKVAAFYDEVSDLLATRTAGVERRTVYTEDGSAPFETPVKGSGYHDQIVASGSDSLFGDIVFGEGGHTTGSVHGTPVDPEEVIRRHPDLIFYEISTTFGGSRTEDFQAVYDSLVARPGWADLAAVKNDRILIANGFATSAVSKLLGSIYLAKLNYPEQFADVEPDDYLRRWIVDFQRAPYEGPAGYVFDREVSQ